MKKYLGVYKDREMELHDYKRYKLSILKQMGIKADAKIFEDATNEIQIDNIAHSIIVSA